MPNPIAVPLRSLAIPIGDVNLDPSNARRHPERNLEAIRASLEAFGQRKPIVVQRKGMIIRAGNGTVLAARALEWPEIAAVVIDEESADAVRFAIADNRSAELAGWDAETLGSLLREIPDADLELLAFNSNELADLFPTPAPGDQANDPSQEWGGMPEYEHNNLESLRRIVVHFKTHEDASAFGRLLEQSVTEKTRTLWFPPDAIGRIADKHYGDEAPE